MLHLRWTAAAALVAVFAAGCDPSAPYSTQAVKSYSPGGPVSIAQMAESRDAPPEFASGWRRSP